MNNPLILITLSSISSQSVNTSLGQIDLFENYSYSIWTYAKNIFYKTTTKKWTYHEHNSLTNSSVRFAIYK